MKREKLKKLKIISVFIITALAFISHFVYDVFPCTLTAIFFPVNESIWEHMKILTVPILINGIIEYIILYKKNIRYNNFVFNLFISSTAIVPIYLVMFLPLYNKFGESMFLSISIMIISIIISQIISYYILKSKNLKLEKISFVLIIIVLIVYGYLTYNPIKTHLFFDTVEEKYGLNDYNI